MIELEFCEYFDNTILAVVWGNVGITAAKND